MATNEFLYSSTVDKNVPLFGKWVDPIKALITDEANIQTEKKSILDALFNVETSNRYGETIMGESDFDTFQAAEEGGKPAEDTVKRTYANHIEHIEFKKEFTITRKMADDAKFGMGANMKNAPRKFVRAYYKTRIKLAAQALINGTSTTMTFNGATVDLKTDDTNKLALFHKAHPYASGKSGTQSNYFCGDLTSEQKVFEEQLSVLANKLRNFKDENGEIMGYTADTIIIPCNRPKLERMVKAAAGSERTTGSSYNDVNTQYGNWTIVVLDGWETDDDRFMVMSSEANKNLLGNMFFNRVKLDIVNGVDEHDRNMFWNGYCRFGVGFGSWKHILLAVNGTVDAATPLD